MPQKKSAKAQPVPAKSGKEQLTREKFTAEKSAQRSAEIASADGISPENKSLFVEIESHVSGDASDVAGEQEQPQTADLLLAVKNGAIRLLARREHSRTELRNKLLLRSHDAALIDQVLDQLADRQLQSDERFAESYTRMRSRRGYGCNKIRAELMSRDVDRDIIEAAIASTDECWIENASSILAKKYRIVSITNSSNAEHAKMRRFLWSRGYNSEQVKLAIQRLSEE